MANPSGEKNIAEETQREVSSCSSADAARGRGGEARGRKQNWEGKEEERREITILLSSPLTLVVCSTERQAPPSPNICESKTLFGRREKEKGQRDFFVHEKKGRGKSQTKSDLFCRLPSKKKIFRKRKKNIGCTHTTCFLSTRHLAVVKRGNPFN